ncbi:MAG: transcription-repair coupling factor [Bacteroidales bacterium]|jgi:transcription-repair coupling factor (superfamily II helicase)|nr:transcription-repair coupling factor [Bacteroidales bacterium]
MDTLLLPNIYKNDERVDSVLKVLLQSGTSARKIGLKGLVGSGKSLVCGSLAKQAANTHLFILQNKEQAAYFHNDLSKIFGQTPKQPQKQLSNQPSNQPSNQSPEQAVKSIPEQEHPARPPKEPEILFFPSSYKRPEEIDNANVLQRTEVLNKLCEAKDMSQVWVVTYPEALAEKVFAVRALAQNIVKIHTNEALSQDFLIDFFDEYGFRSVDFVAEPGEYALRGGIIDIYSYSNDLPYRVEMDGEKVASIRTFEVGTQRSIERVKEMSVLPLLQTRIEENDYVPFLDYFSPYSILWTENLSATIETFDDCIKEQIQNYTVVELGSMAFYKHHFSQDFSMNVQPLFNKRFDMLVENILSNADNGVTTLISSENPKQIKRLERVFSELSKERKINIIAVPLSLHEGFVDVYAKTACYTDHQIFERFHGYNVSPHKADKQALTIKELYALKSGDYVSHIDHGIGQFAGLEKISINGREQEVIRLLYKDNDLLRISIHSLHKITRYSGKDGEPPVLHRLGGNAWTTLKNRAKKKIKDIARDLIRLYAKRKGSKGFAFSADNYLQHELEASFFYEDTPDQLKATIDVKQDMEAENPMDRLVCGDVGFGKTEVAIRAAFKAVCDSKQVAVLVPTTVLAYQHYNTFKERLEGLPCNVDYLNRFRSAQDKRKILQRLESGKIDILIGTHRIVSKDVVFKDLGLLIIDEEQKFGVATKEKLKSLKVNIDTLTLTATPIPRTLQFSLMGARDLSLIQTPPPNRYPISTELHSFDETYIRDAIIQELERGGQVFFVHHRVENIDKIADLVKALVPDAKVAIAHGQMDGEKLEEVLLGFIEGVYDILVSTKIVESGLDIPNANTIIINNAHQYGLSELYQLRGRVGRSNRKAYCYMLIPSKSLLTSEAQRRLNAIEEFSDIGSGFQISMRDLDIRGAGNVLGGEQSGFIAEIGYDMYQKILDEAMIELREEEMSSSTQQGQEQEQEQEQERECMTESLKEWQFDSDLELLIPDNYVSNITERLSLYKDLNALDTDIELAEFRLMLEDRFGAIPASTEDLLQTIVLRRLSIELGWKKIVLKGGVMTATFGYTSDTDYYHSKIFAKILDYIQKNPKTSMLKEKGENLTIVFSGIESVGDAVEVSRAVLTEM